MADRRALRGETPTIDEFLAGLDLRVTISEPAPEQVDRFAQLTQRTNQFNFTTIRRNDSEIRQLRESGLECRAVEVRDRFGDYGLVGVMIFDGRREALEVDTFLLSCRVLGRGVEHRMLNELGEIARRRYLRFRYSFWRLVLYQAATLPLLLAGLSLRGLLAGGLAWFALAVILSIAVALLNAWVLLVEILR